MGAISLYKFEPGAKPGTLNANEASVVVHKAYSQIVAVLVKIPGPSRHEVELKSITPKTNGSSLFIDLTIVNKGNVIEGESEGIIRISQGGKLLFEKKGAMKSIYPGNSAVYSFEAPADLITSGTFDADISWTYGSGKQEAHASFRYELSAKEVKQAVMTEMASEGDTNLSKDAIVLNPDDLWTIGAIAAAVIVLLLGVMIFFFRRREQRKGRNIDQS